MQSQKSNLKQKASFSFDAIGTGWQIDIYQDISDIQQQEVLDAIMERIELFDVTYSRFRKDSLVTAISNNDGVYELPPDAELLMRVYKSLYEITEGRMTPLIGQVLVDAGYDANYSLERRKELVQPPAWEEVLDYKHPVLTTKKPVLLDFGAAGKGYLVDIVGDILREKSIESFCIDAGGDMYYQNKSDTSLKVGLENPEDFSQVIGVVELVNSSLCGSAGSRRKWAEFNHIIDPFELSSPKDTVATWVIAKTTIMADALASGLFFVPASAFAGHYDFEYLMLKSDHSFEKSTNFPGEIFYEIHR